MSRESGLPPGVTNADLEPGPDPQRVPFEDRALRDEDRFREEFTELFDGYEADLADLLTDVARGRLRNADRLRIAGWVEYLDKRTADIEDAILADAQQATKMHY